MNGWLDIGMGCQGIGGVTVPGDKFMTELGTQCHGLIDVVEVGHQLDSEVFSNLIDSVIL